ncbi:MAG: hypothetical protein Q8P49_03695, partial [Candidatus Liptonbacteria bacterium]|nr:hypothetical protein [Candidatus Liptonbacteria bacterium]
ERYLEAARKADGGVDNVFAKGLAKGMSGEQLERFYAEQGTDHDGNPISDIDRIKIFAGHRGLTKMDENLKAFRHSGKQKEFIEAVERELGGISDADTRFNEGNANLSSWLTRLTGKGASAFGVSQHLNNDIWQRKAKRSFKDYAQTLDNDAAQDFGKEAKEAGPEYEETRQLIGEYALPDKLAYFVREMPPEQREAVIAEAITKHIGDGNYLFKLRRDALVSSIAEDKGYDLDELIKAAKRKK